MSRGSDGTDELGFTARLKRKKTSIKNTQIQSRILRSATNKKTMANQRTTDYPEKMTTLEVQQLITDRPVVMLERDASIDALFASRPAPWKR